MPAKTMHDKLFKHYKPCRIALILNAYEILSLSSLS